jgi:hypothetical protein
MLPWLAGRPVHARPVDDGIIHANLLIGVAAEEQEQRFAMTMGYFRHPLHLP